jgi:hypothetical protein
MVWIGKVLYMATIKSISYERDTKDDRSHGIRGAIGTCNIFCVRINNNSNTMKDTLEQLEQDAIQVRHRMKRAQYADDLILMDQYAAELGEIKSKINKIKNQKS